MDLVCSINDMRGQNSHYCRIMSRVKQFCPEVTRREDTCLDGSRAQSFRFEVQRSSMDYVFMVYKDNEKEFDLDTCTVNIQAILKDFDCWLPEFNTLSLVQGIVRGIHVHVRNRIDSIDIPVKTVRGGH